MKAKLKPSPLVLVRHYLPGFRFGGQIRSTANFVAALREDVDFRILCLDRDAGDDAAYSGIVHNEWMNVDGARVRYLRPGWSVIGKILAVLREPPRDGVLYLNGFFDPHFSIWPRLAIWLGLAPKRPIVIAPRGEFSPGALGLRRVKKATFLVVSKLLGLHARAHWHATTDIEAQDIRNASGAAPERIHTVTIIARVLPFNEVEVQPRTNTLRVVFLSRISPKKNLLFALQTLRNVRCNVRFTIIGPIEDRAYWEECERERKSLPTNVEVVHDGEVSPDLVGERLAAHDVFFLPTLGENFGHVVLEALQAGLPLVLSDQTPWLELKSKGIGYDIALRDKDEFVRAIEELASLPAEKFAELRRRARAYSLQHLREQEQVAQMRALFALVRSA